MESEPSDDRGSVVHFMLHHPSTTIPPFLISLFFFGFAYIFNAKDISQCFYFGGTSFVTLFGISYGMVLNNLRAKKRFRSTLADVPAFSSVTSGLTLSSADISLSPRYASVRSGMWMPLFIVISIIYLYFAFMGGGLSNFSLVLLIGIFAVWCACYFIVSRFIIRAQERNFYFKCDDTKVELRRGTTNKTVVIFSYSQITDLKVWQERTGAGRYSNGRLLDLYDVSISVNGSAHSYGGFTEGDAQKIVDFILPRIKKSADLT